MSNTLPEISCPQKDKAVILVEKILFFPVLGGWGASASLHKLQETHQMVVISAVGPESGFNCRLKEKLIADILSLIKKTTRKCTRKMFKCISWTQAASYLASLKICEVS